MDRSHERLFRGLPGGPEALVTRGPVVLARLRVDRFVQEMKLANAEPVDSVDVHLLVDTGASMSMLDSRVVQHLGLRPVRPTNVVVANNTVSSVMIHRASIALPMDASHGGDMVLFEIFAAALPPGPAPMAYDGLIGRDFLQRFELLYDGPRGLFGMRTHVPGE